MSEDLLERYIVEHLDTFPGATVMFSWHGGEPMLAGLRYFRQIVAIQRKHRRSGIRVANGIQTNGMFLNDEWCRFLSAEGFRVGLSLDGPQNLHDSYRVSKSGRASHDQALRGLKLLQRYHVPYDVLCTVHKRNVSHPLEVYRFFKRLGVPSLGLLPIVARATAEGEAVTPESVPPAAFGDFLCRIFDEWLRQDTDRMVVQMFEEAARPARGLEHSLCIFRKECGDIPVLERGGDFYSCDHYVTAAHRIGNIASTPLVDLLEHPRQRAFGVVKSSTLPRQCRTCEFLDMCNGGCPKDRFVSTPDGEPGLNYLCQGYKRFFAHVRPHTQRLTFLGTVGEQSLSRRSDDRNLHPAAAGRNDPCPCGSGEKYKRCCLRPIIRSF